MRAGFVARRFTGYIDHLAELIAQGIACRGFALIDVLQPCVSFNLGIKQPCVLFKMGIKQPCVLFKNF